MTEKYLHFIWRNKRLPLVDLTLTDGRSMNVVHFGFYNSLGAGPDFSSGIVEIDGRTTFGPIELHVRSSDWYRHGHQDDMAYNDVILHVVYIHDKEVEVNGRILPTLELKSIIDPFHLALMNRKLLKDSVLPCAPRSARMFELEEMKELSIQRRLSELYKFAGFNINEAYGLLLARAFGRSRSPNPFLERHRNPSATITTRKDGLYPIASSSIRVRQFDQLIKLDDLSVLMDRICLNKYLKLNNVRGLTDAFHNHLLLNVALPLGYFNKEINLDAYFNFLKDMPPENNAIVRTWVSAEVPIRNAFDSQGLNRLYRERCSEKKCLTCAVGKAIISNDPEDSFLF